MPLEIAAQIIIRAPLGRVATFAANPDNTPAWCKHVRSTSRIRSNAMQAGDRITFTVEILGRRIEYDVEVAEYIPHRRLLMRADGGDAPAETRYEWEPNPDGTTFMTYRRTGTPKAFPGPLARLVAWELRRTSRDDLSRLKSILESR
jgi:uncharacterized membrane protein